MCEYCAEIADVDEGEHRIVIECPVCARRIVVDGEDYEKVDKKSLS